VNGQMPGPAEHVLEVVTPRTNAARLSSAEHLFGALVPRGAGTPAPVSLEIVGDAEKFRQHFLVDLLGEGLSLIFVALAMTFEAMAEHFVKENGSGTSAEKGRTVVRLGDGGFAQILEVRGHLVNLGGEFGFAREVHGH